MPWPADGTERPSSPQQAASPTSHRPNQRPPDAQPRPNPAAEVSYMLNARRLELPYETQFLENFPGAKVQLWGTVDGGQNWAVYAVDEDRVSPLVVDLPGEGIYGFRLVVAGQGPSAERPRPGDVPHHTIGIDLTPPQIQELVVTSEAFDGSPALTVRWRTDDWRLDGEPVRLLYSHTPQGPWSPMAEGLPASGNYRWRPTGPVGPQIFVQLALQDVAGNVATYTAPPATLPSPAPQGRILDVRPAR